MYMYAKFDQTSIQSGYKVMSIHSDRITPIERTAAEATGCLNALWR